MKILKSNDQGVVLEMTQDEMGHIISGVEMDVRHLEYSLAEYFRKEKDAGNEYICKKFSEWIDLKKRMLRLWKRRNQYGGTPMEMESTKELVQ